MYVLPRLYRALARCIVSKKPGELLSARADREKEETRARLPMCHGNEPRDHIVTNRKRDLCHLRYPLLLYRSARVKGREKERTRACADFEKGRIVYYATC